MSDRWIVIDSLNRRRLAAILSTFGFIAAVVGAATLVPSYANPSCPPIAARFDAADGGSVVVRVCGEFPSPLVASRFTLRYDLQLRIGIVIPVAELLGSKIDSSRR